MDCRLPHFCASINSAQCSRLRGLLPHSCFHFAHSTELLASSLTRLITTAPHAVEHQFRRAKGVLYPRAHRPLWHATATFSQCGCKRNFTGECDFDITKTIHCDYFAELKFKEKDNLPLNTRRFVDTVQLAIKQMRSALGYRPPALATTILIDQRPVMY